MSPRIARKSGPTARHGALFAAACLLAVMAPVVALSAPARADAPPELTAATNSYDDEPALTPQTVGGGSFGERWTSPVDGQVYADPVFSAGTMIVGTESDHLYGLDPGTGAVRWERHDLGAPFDPATQIASGPCGDISPQVGITSTPAVGPDGTVYAVAKVADDGDGVPGFSLHAVDPTTGVERAGFPVALGGVADNAPSIGFSAATENQRAGLLISGGVVYVAFGAHCDLPPYRGWVFGVATGGAVRARWVDETAPEPGPEVSADDRPDGGIWQGGAPLISDGGTGFYLTTGNGQFAAAPTPGAQPPAALGESVVHLRPDATTGKLAPVDFYTPNFAQFLNDQDVDLGSGGLTVLPDSFGTTAHPHLAVVGGKSGDLWLLDRDHLNGFKQGTAASDYDSALSRLNVFPGIVFGRIAASAATGCLYARVGSSLEAIRVGSDGAGTPTLSVAAADAGGAVSLAGSPIVTGSGGDPDTGLVWTEWEPNNLGTGAQLQAYRAEPDTTGATPKLDLVWSGAIGTAAKFQSPVVHGGVVYTAGRDGIVRAFASPTTAAVAGRGGNLGSVVVGQTAAATVTVMAQQPVTVTGLSVTGPAASQFSLAAPGPTLPQTLAQGAALRVPVVYAPTAAGGAAATVMVATDAGSFAVPLSGVGIWPFGHLQLDHGPGTPSTLALGAYPVTQPASPPLITTLTLANDGATPLVLKVATPPAAPYTATVPVPGDTLMPGQQVTETVTFSAQAPGEHDDSYLIQWAGKQTGSLSSGENAPTTTTVALQATAASAADVPAPSPVDFGAATVGTSVTRTLTLTNVGGITALVAKSKPPADATITGLGGLPEGSTIPPGGSVSVVLTWTPTAPGALEESWLINAGQGVLSVQLTGIARAALAGSTPGGGGGPPGGATPTGGPSTTGASTPPSAPAQGRAALPEPGRGAGWRHAGSLRHVAGGFTLGRGASVTALAVTAVRTTTEVTLPDRGTLTVDAGAWRVRLARRGSLVAASLLRGGSTRAVRVVRPTPGGAVTLSFALVSGRWTASVAGRRLPVASVGSPARLTLAASGRPVTVLTRFWSAVRAV